MHQKIPEAYFLLTLIAVSLVLTFFIFQPFIVVLALAIVFAMVLQPLYHFVLRGMRRAPGLAAFVTMLISVVCILVPLTFVTLQITSEAQRAYVSLSNGDGETYLGTLFQYANDTVAQYVPSLALSHAEISASVDQYARNSLAWLIQNLGGAFGGITQLALGFFVFLIAVYYFLRDGLRLKQVIIDISPLAEADNKLLCDRLELSVNSIIRGSLLIGLIQGILTGIGFSFFGVPNSILWGVVAAFCALIPGIGTSLVLIPGVAYLFIMHATTPAIGLLIWSVFAVGLIDNLLGPRLVGRGMQVHPLAVLLAVFGGIAYFGPAGVFLGPLCISFLFSLLSIHLSILKKSKPAPI